VTLDEVVALEKAGLSDNEILERLRATNQVFELSEDQENYLKSNGVSANVVAQMELINEKEREQVSRRGDVIGRDPARNSGNRSSDIFPGIGGSNSR
jgi:hypothetical protein